MAANDGCRGEEEEEEEAGRHEAIDNLSDVVVALLTTEIENVGIDDADLHSVLFGGHGDADACRKFAKDRGYDPRPGKTKRLRRWHIALHSVDDTPPEFVSITILSGGGPTRRECYRAAKIQ